MASHGTLRGYYQHRRQGELPCDPCHYAWAHHAINVNANNRIHAEARKRLIKRHRPEYREIVAEIRRERTPMPLDEPKNSQPVIEL